MSNLKAAREELRKKRASWDEIYFGAYKQEREKHANLLEEARLDYEQAKRTYVKLYQQQQKALRGR